MEEGGVKSEMLDRWVVGGRVLQPSAQPGCPPPHPAAHTALGSGSQISPLFSCHLPCAERGGGGLGVPGACPGWVPTLCPPGQPEGGGEKSRSPG